jgi:multiple sugar transport system permease protein
MAEMAGNKPMKTFYLLLKYAILHGRRSSRYVSLGITTSFKTANGVTSGATYIPWLQYEPSLEGWKVLVRTGGAGIDIVQPYLSSIIVTVSASLISLVLGTLAAYGLSRFTYRLGFVKNSDITFFFISQRIMPPIVLAIPFFLMLQLLRLLDSCRGSGLYRTAAAHSHLGDGRFLQQRAARD